MDFGQHDQRLREEPAGGGCRYSLGMDSSCKSKVGHRNLGKGWNGLRWLKLGIVFCACSPLKTVKKKKKREKVKRDERRVSGL